MSSPSKNGQNLTTSSNSSVTRAVSNEMRQYHREYARKRRQDDGFRKKEADNKREYRKFKKVAELKMEDEFSIMEAKVERLQRKVDQFDEFLILLFQNEGSKDSFEEDDTQTDSVEEPNVEHVRIGFQGSTVHGENGIISSIVWTGTFYIR
jgi:hypothetical protein